MTNANGCPESTVNKRCLSGQPCVHTEEISILEEKIANQKARKEFKRQFKLHISYASNEIHDPLSRIPPEVASDILYHSMAIPEHHDWFDGNPLYYIDELVKVSTRPLEIASVCKRWRDIALAEPRLWTNIVMRRAAQTWKLPQELVEQWIARTGALPLVFVLIWEPKKDELNNEIITLVKRICSLSHRWESVLFNVPSAFLSIVRCDNPALTDLKHFTFVTSDSNGIGELSLGSATFRPKTVMLGGIWTPPTDIIWTGVTELIMHDVIPEALLAILPDITHLGKLRATFIPNDTDTTYPAPTTAIDLPHLTTMTIEEMEAEDVGKFFSKLRARSLRSLTISRTEDENAADVFTLTDFRCLIMESEQTLEGLALTNFSFFGEDLISLLETLPLLRTLAIECPEEGANAFSDTLFNRLSSTVRMGGDDNFLPALTMLHYNGPRTFSWQAIAEFLEAHNKCRESRSKVPKLRPFFNLGLTVEPKNLPHDLIGRNVLKRFTKLPESRMLTIIDSALMEASFRHCRMYMPPRVFRSS